MKKRSILLSLGAIVLLITIGLAAFAGGYLAYRSMQAQPVQAFSPPRLDPIHEKGILISSVLTDSPATEVGLKRGDILLEVDGEEVNSFLDLKVVLDEKDFGDEVELLVLRGDEQLILTASLSEQDGVAYLGISYAPAPSRIPGMSLGLPPVFFYTDPEHAKPFDLPEGVSSGVLVGKVVEGGPADQAGLQKGDLITAIDGKAIRDLNPRDFTKTIQAYQPGDSVTLSVVRRDETESSQTQTLEIQVILEEDPDQPGKAYLGIYTMGFFQIDRNEARPGNFHFELPGWLPFRDSPDHLLPDEDLKPGVEI